MKLDKISIGNQVQFKGQRVWKSTISQLTRNNPYSLTEPNQRFITQSIENLGKKGGFKNIKFLIDSAQKLTYSTNIHLKDVPKNNWKSLLLAAAGIAAAITPAVMKNSISEKIHQVENNHKLKKIEKEILALRAQLLAVVDLEQINNEMKGSGKDFERNLDYFIVSSETTLEHKKYVLERLNYFMSDEYKINPQLKDKKSIAAAEMINDMAISVPGNKYPNIKAVNQKQHGICAAISIVRKKLAYEDKPNYVDAIISELDNTNILEAYDRSELGTKKKIKLEKVNVDFNTALKNGYRIIDASTMHWMQAADMSGSNNISLNNYYPFDKENFDVQTDTFFNAQFADPDLQKAHSYYQALTQAKSIIENFKASKIKASLQKEEVRRNSAKYIAAQKQICEKLEAKISRLAPELSQKDISKILSGIFNLEHEYSDQIKPGDDFAYIPNEENSVKTEKIKNYIIHNSNIKSIPDEEAEAIFSLVDYYNSIVSSNKTSSSNTGKISKARRLYKVAAAFRYQIVKGLEETRTLENVMLNEGISNKEALIVEAIDKLIEKLKNNSPDSELIIKQVYPAFEGLEATAEDMIAGLEGLKDILNTTLTKDLDEIYASLAMVSRKEQLFNYLEIIKARAIEDDTKVIKSFANVFGIKNSKNNLIKTIEKYQQKLKENDEAVYKELFEKLGNTSQIQYINNLYGKILNKISEEDNHKIVTALLSANNLPLADDEESFIKRLGEIKNKINYIEHFLQNLSKIVRVVDENGEIISTAEPAEVIMKKLENENRVVSTKKLAEIQEHLAKINKDSSIDEFQSRQMKLHDKSLYNFSKQELETLKDTEQSINVMYSYVKKQLNYVQSDMREDLEAIKRYIGVQKGRYWISETGRGLPSDSQIRILEYMTGRPHYEEKNLKKAIEKIKTSPYSGITSSSVYHDELGWHAQYAADIKPVKIKVKDKDGSIKEETRDVLFHDNTWGASERENVWTDSYGLKRTDYSDQKGGTLGYITDENFRNGNFVDRILNEMTLNEKPDYTQNKVYKKIKHIDPLEESYNSPQYSDIILDGQSPKTRNTAASIHDAIFVPETRYITRLEKLSEARSEEELQAKITSIENSGKIWRPVYQKLKERIFSNADTIRSIEDYNKLPDNDYLKVVLEKIALKKNYQILDLEPSLAEVRDLKRLSKFKSAQKTRALNSFKYAFSKDYNITEYLADSFGEVEDLEVTELLNKFNLKLTDEEANSIGKTFEIDTEKFDGSLKTAINLIMSSLNKDINKVVSDKKANTALKNYYRNFINKTLYFNKSDINNKNLEHIIKFIDREFDPADDEELVKIYNEIQNMTSKEFKEKILSKVKPEDLGIEDYTGYGVLKQIQNYNEEMNTALINTVYYDSIVPELKSEKYENKYIYERFSRKARTLQELNFNTMYRNMAAELSLLTYPKLFNKTKGEALYKYGIFPAFPKLDYMGSNLMTSSFNDYISDIEEKIETIKSINEQIENYNISHRLSDYLKKAKTQEIPSNYQYKNINLILGRLITVNYGDTSIPEILEAAELLLEFPKETPWAYYIPYLEKIINRFNDFEATTPKKVLEQTITNYKRELAVNKKDFANIFIQPKYRNRFLETTNTLEQVLIKPKDIDIERFKEDFYAEFEKYHILQDTKEILNLFITSSAKDSELNKYHNNYKQLLTRALEYSSLVEVQDILMDAIKNGHETSTKKLFATIDVKSADGNNLNMSSSQILISMVAKLVLDDNLDTALMFLEKLGLNEKFVVNMQDCLDFEEAQKAAKQAHTTASNFSEFRKFIDPVFSETEKRLETDSRDYNHILNKLKKTIKDAGEKFEIDKNAVKILLKAVDNTKYTCSENENANKALVYNNIISQAKINTANVIQSLLTPHNEMLRSLGFFISMINNIELLPDTEANNARNAMNQQYQEIEEFIKSLPDLQENENSDKI